MRRLKYWQAISEATVQCMEVDPDVFIAGIGVDDFKGIFGTTRDAFLKFGRSRVFDIPNCENAFAGIALGAAAVGKRPLVVHPRNDFMFLALDQIVNLAAKWRHMYATERGVPIVCRGIVLFTARRYDEAIETLKQAHNPTYELRCWQAASYAAAGWNSPCGVRSSTSRLDSPRAPTCCATSSICGRCRRE